MKNSRIRLPSNHENCILLPPRALLGLWPLQPLRAVICLALTAASTNKQQRWLQELLLERQGKRESVQCWVSLHYNPRDKAQITLVILFYVKGVNKKIYRSQRFLGSAHGKISQQSLITLQFVLNHNNL